MDTDRLNHRLTLAANIGVIVGIVFLVLELRQNTQMTMAQSRQQMARDTTDLLTMNLNDPVFVDVVDRGMAGDELTRIEERQFQYRSVAFIWHWQNLVYQHRIGLYDDDEFELQIAIARQDIGNFPGFKKLWCDTKQWLASPALIEAIEAESSGSFC